MPTFNRAHLLEKTIGAILRQDANQEWWKLTVVDNASTDGTRSLLERLSSIHRNLDFTVNETNLGLFGNLNRCMDLAQTDKYMIIHSDDFVEPNLVSTVVGMLERHPDINMWFSPPRAFFEKTGEMIDHWYQSKIIGDQARLLNHREFISALLRSSSNFIFAPTVVYDRNFFTADLRYSNEYGYTSDLDLWFRAGARQPSVGFIPTPLITCVIHSERLSEQHARQMRLEALSIVRKYSRMFRKHPDFQLFGSRTWSVIQLRLFLFSLAVRLNLIPDFRMRRRIAGLMESIIQ